MHPILPYIDRKCSVSKSGYSLQPWLDFTVPRGMPIHIPIAAIQRDAKVTRIILFILGRFMLIPLLNNIYIILDFITTCLTYIIHDVTKYKKKT